MSANDTTAPGVITYDVTQAKPAITALLAERFKTPADVVVAAVLTLAELTGIDPERKIEAMQLAATLSQQILSAIYAGTPFPVLGSAPQAKQAVQTEVRTVEVDAPVNPALQALADLLVDGDIDTLLAQLTVMFGPLDGLDETEAANRLKVAGLVIGGKRGYELDSEGKLAVAALVRKLREDLANAQRDVAAQIDRAKREATAAARRDIDAELDRVRREATEAARRGIDAEIDRAKREATDAAQRAAATTAATVKRGTDAEIATAKREAEEANAKLRAWAPVIDAIMGYRDPDGDDDKARAVRDERMRSAIAAARGHMSIEDYVALRDALQDVWNSIVNARGTNANRATGMLMQSTRDTAARFFASAG